MASQIPPSVNFWNGNQPRHAEFSSHKSQYAFYTPGKCTFLSQNTGEEQTRISTTLLLTSSVLPPTIPADCGHLIPGELAGQFANFVAIVRQPLSGHHYAFRFTTTPKIFQSLSSKPSSKPADELPLFISNFENTTNACVFTESENLNIAVLYFLKKSCLIFFFSLYWKIKFFFYFSSILQENLLFSYNRKFQ